MFAIPYDLLFGTWMFQTGKGYKQLIWILCLIEIINNKARHKVINVKYRQMVFWSVGGAVVGSFWKPLGQTKVMHNHQRETTHEICCLAAKKSIFPETLLGGSPADTSLVVHTLFIKPLKYVRIPQSQFIDLENSSNQRHFVWYLSLVLTKNQEGAFKEGYFLIRRCLY